MNQISTTWKIDEVDSAEDAVKAAMAAHSAKTSYDLIVIDQDFGKQGMLGTEATATMREVGVRSLIVGFTGDSHEGHDKHARAVGQDYVLGKPFTDSAKLRRILQRLAYDRDGARGLERGRWGNTI